MSIEASEKECAANAKAPRVSLADIERAIAERHEFTGADICGVKKDHPLAILSACIVVMKNGFTVIGKSAPASPANFNPELGKKLAYEDCIRQLWPLMGFALCEKLTSAK